MYTHESVCAVLGCLDVTLNFVLVHMYIRTYVYCMYVPCEKEFMTCFWECIRKVCMKRDWRSALHMHTCVYDSIHTYIHIHMVVLRRWMPPMTVMRICMLTIPKWIWWSRVSVHFWGMQWIHYEHVCTYVCTTMHVHSCNNNMSKYCLLKMGEPLAWAGKSLKHDRAAQHPAQISHSIFRHCKTTLLYSYTHYSDRRCMPVRGGRRFDWVQSSNCIHLLWGVASSTNVTTMHFCCRSMPLLIISMNQIFCYSNTKMILVSCK